MNKLIKIDEGYVYSVGQDTQFATNQVVAGTTMFSAKGSTQAFGCCCDPSGNIWVTDPARHAIFKVVPSGPVYAYAGLPGTSGNNGANIVSLSAARFNTPRGICCDASGNLYVADTGNHQIRKIDQKGYVSLIAGSPTAASGYVNGTAATFNAPWGICIDKSNRIFIADSNNHAIRMMKQGMQTVYTVAGTGVAGDVVGLGTVARFRSPKGIVATQSGTLYVADSGNYKVKKMDGSFKVYTFCGLGTRGTAIGAPDVAQFLDQLYMTIDNSNNIYVIDFDEGEDTRVVKVNGNGYVTVVYGYGATPDIAGGITVNNSGFIYIIQSENVNVFYSSSSSSSSESSESSSSESSESSESEGNTSSSSSSSSFEQIL